MKILVAMATLSAFVLSGCGYHSDVALIEAKTQQQVAVLNTGFYCGNIINVDTGAPSSMCFDLVLGAKASYVLIPLDENRALFADDPPYLHIKSTAIQSGPLAGSYLAELGNGNSWDFVVIKVKDTKEFDVFYPDCRESCTAKTLPEITTAIENTAITNKDFLGSFRMRGS